MLASRKQDSDLCLVGLLATYQARERRVRGARPRCRRERLVRRNPDDADAKVVADAARTFILSDGLGYQ